MTTSPLTAPDADAFTSRLRDAEDAKLDKTKMSWADAFKKAERIAARNGLLTKRKQAMTNPQPDAHVQPATKSYIRSARAADAATNAADAAREAADAAVKAYHLAEKAWEAAKVATGAADKAEVQADLANVGSIRDPQQDKEQ